MSVVGVRKVPVRTARSFFGAALAAVSGWWRWRLEATIEGWRTGRMRMFGAVVLGIGTTVEATDLSRLFVTVGPHVVVKTAFPTCFFLLTLNLRPLVGLLFLHPVAATAAKASFCFSISSLFLRLEVVLLARLSLRTTTLLLLDDGCLGAQAGHDRTVVVTIATGHHTATTEPGTFGGVAQRLAVGTFTPQHGRFIILPISLSPFEAAVLGPEEKPDRSNNERGSDQGKQRLNTLHIDRIRWNGSLTRDWRLM